MHIQKTSLFFGLALIFSPISCVNEKQTLNIYRKHNLKSQIIACNKQRQDFLQIIEKSRRNNTIEDQLIEDRLIQYIQNNCYKLKIERQSLKKELRSVKKSIKNDHILNINNYSIESLECASSVFLVTMICMFGNYYLPHATSFDAYMVRGMVGIGMCAVAFLWYTYLESYKLSNEPKKPV